MDAMTFLVTSQRISAAEQPFQRFGRYTAKWLLKTQLYRLSEKRRQAGRGLSIQHRVVGLPVNAAEKSTLKRRRMSPACTSQNSRLVGKAES